VLPRKSTIYTDGWRAYDGLVMEGYKHHRIHHHDNEFARDRRHINGIESFWSYAKLRLAKLRGVRWEYFYDHLKETEWRFLVGALHHWREHAAPMVPWLRRYIAQGPRMDSAPRCRCCGTAHLKGEPT
jgi:transposase-like protein